MNYLQMQSSNAVHSLNWYLKYIGVPLAIGVTMCKLFNCITTKRRRAALQGKVVVITGASSGIGEALAHAFYEQGSKVILASRRKSELERVKNDLMLKNLAVALHPGKIQGGIYTNDSRPESIIKWPTATLEPLVLELDLAKFVDMHAFVQNVYDACGHIDILINNGGISHRGSILNTNIDVFESIMAINYFGSVALTKEFLPKMVQRKVGHIVLVSSVQGLIAIPDRSAYAAAKHAMQAFGDSLRAEMHQHNVNVTVVSPGYIKTAISLNAYTDSGEPHGVMDKSTAAGFTPQYTAKKILDGIVNKEKDLVISQFVPNLAITLRHSAPSLYHWVMARRANKTS